MKRTFSLSTSVLTTLMAWPLASACHRAVAPDASELRIDSGWFVGDGGSGDSEVPAVYQIAMPTDGGEGLCTGTAVSDNTLVAAGHCIINISEGGQKMAKVCLTHGDQRPTSTCSTTLLVPSSWETSGDFRQDVAVVIFPHGTFQHFIPLRSSALSVGADLVLVGFSDANLEVQGQGMKRWGKNKIDRFDGDNAIISNYGNDGNNVAVSPGDSGGPLLVSCQLAGVASREEEAGSKSSLHTNLTDPVNQSWLKGLRAQGAEFCGLDGASPSACPAASMASPRTGAAGSGANGQPLFPCADATAQGGAVSKDVYLALDASNGFHAGAPSTAASVQICAGKSGATCTGAVRSSQPERTLGDRLMFAVSMPALAAGSDNFFVVTAFDSAGAKVAETTVEIH